jgi:hypothetical protein
MTFYFQVGKERGNSSKEGQGPMETYSDLDIDSRPGSDYENLNAINP